MTGKADKSTVVVLLVAEVKLIVSEPTVTEPLTSVCPVEVERVIAHRKATVGKPSPLASDGKSEGRPVKIFQFALSTR
jgi:hypothetical protein